MLYHCVVEDIDSDYIQCRWAQSMQEECDDLCSVLLPAILNASTVSVQHFHCNNYYFKLHTQSYIKCELHHLATSGPGVFFVALQIEDFTSALAANTTTRPLSSIPLQFVAVVTGSPLSCTDRPRLTGTTRVDGSCVGVPFNSTWSEPIVAQTTSSDTRYDTA